MQFTLLTVSALLTVAFAAAPVAVDAGGPESPPTTSAHLTAVPTVAQSVTHNGTASIAPLPTSAHPYPLSNTTNSSGNLSTSAGGGKHHSQSVVLITTTGAGGKPTTRTSTVGASATETGAGGKSTGSATGSTQPGAGSNIRGGAVAALGALAGLGAAFL